VIRLVGLDADEQHRLRQFGHNGRDIEARYDADGAACRPPRIRRAYAITRQMVLQEQTADEVGRAGLAAMRRHQLARPGCYSILLVNVPRDLAPQLAFLLKVGASSLIGDLGGHPFALFGFVLVVRAKGHSARIRQRG
jgi:hypothetical protein